MIRIGSASPVATSSDDAPEVEVVGGGSNAWNGGDYLHYLYNPTAISGDFDVALKVSQYQRPNTAGQGGYSNSGLELRQAVYNAGAEYTQDGTKVPMVANTTYCNYAGGPGRGAIPLWRNDVGGGYGNGNAGYGWGTVINGVKATIPGSTLRTRSVSRIHNLSPPRRTGCASSVAGETYTFYASWDGLVWMW